MKKILGILLAAVMIFGFATSALAERVEYDLSFIVTTSISATLARKATTNRTSTLHNLLQSRLRRIMEFEGQMMTIQTLPTL